MANNLPALDSAFHALADPTRRAVLARLAKGPAAVGELARPLSIGLPTLLKHLKVLEHGGLIATEKAGRVRVCHARPERLRVAESWLQEQRTVWESRTDRLADYGENTLAKDSSR